MRPAPLGLEETGKGSKGVLYRIVSRESSRWTARRGVLVALIVVTTAAVLALGDPLAHPEAGEQATGQRGLVGVPRVVFVAALAIAFVVAWPPNRGGGSGQPAPEETGP